MKLMKTMAVAAIMGLVSVAAYAEAICTSIPNACDRSEWRNGFFPYVVTADAEDFLQWTSFRVEVNADFCEASVSYADPSGSFISGTAECFMEGGESRWIDMRVDKISSSTLMVDFRHTILGFEAHGCGNG